MREGPLGFLHTEQQPGSIINEGLDRHLKLISISDILDDPTNNEESAEVYPTLQRIGRQEGFTVKVVEASPTVWIRDDFLGLSNDTLLAPSSDPDVKGALNDLVPIEFPLDMYTPLVRAAWSGIKKLQNSRTMRAKLAWSSRIRARTWKEAMYLLFPKLMAARAS